MGLLDDGQTKSAFEKCKKAILKNIALWGLCLLGVLIMVVEVGYFSVFGMSIITAKEWYLVILLILMVLIALGMLYWFAKTFFAVVNDFRAKTVFEFEAKVVDKRTRKTSKSIGYFIKVENREGKLKEYVINAEQYARLAIEDHVTMYLGYYSQRCLVIE